MIRPRPSVRDVGLSYSRTVRESSKFLTHDEFKDRQYFPVLDGLRALAILLVLFHHVPGSGGHLLEALHSNARYGVSVFFVISGFLISTLFLREKEKMGKVNILN